jgi:hypothetical protein
MKTSLISRCAAMLASLLFAAATAGADAPKYGLAAGNHIEAQRLVNEIMASNPNLVSAGMHCVPRDGGPQSIIASTLNVIGKPSDPPDVDVGQHGETIISPNMKIPKLGVMLPLRDREGHDIGALALAFKFPAGADQVKCFATATEIRNQVAQRIPSLAALFAPAP